MTQTLESILSGDGYARLPASSLQRALCRAAEGMPIGDELTDDEVLAYFGCERSRLGLSLPVLVCVVAGVRGGKSFFVASGAIRDALVADCSQLLPHERPRHAIVAPSVDNATATFRILRGIIEGSRVLAAMVVGEPTTDTIVLRRPDGREVEIVVVAAHRGGMTLRSRWLAGATLDEVALFGIETAGAAVNAEEILRAAETRVLPRTQVRIVSSPMGRQGLLYDLYRQHFGEPGRVLVVHAPTRALNPSFPEAAIEAVRARDPDAAAREHDARWIDGVTSFISGENADACVRSRPVVRPLVGGAVYSAAMDAGTRGNAWTLVLARMVKERIEITLAHQWQGSKESPLSPAATLREIASMLRPYHVRDVACDGHAFDANADLAKQCGLRLVQRSTSDRDGGYDALQSFITSRQIDLPPVPLLIQDLKSIQKILTPTGYRISLPLTPDGRHADFAPATALAVAGCTAHVIDTPGAKQKHAAAKMRAALQTVNVNDLALEFDQEDVSAAMRRMLGH
jgi:hypothetical protein